MKPVKGALGQIGQGEPQVAAAYPVADDIKPVSVAQPAPRRHDPWVPQGQRLRRPRFGFIIGQPLDQDVPPAVLAPAPSRRQRRKRSGGQRKNVFKL